MKRWMMVLFLSLILVMIFSAVTLAVGARALGMGEAFTAIAEGPTAAYWNPAGLISTKVINLGISVGMPPESFQYFSQALSEGYSFSPGTGNFDTYANVFATLQFKHFAGSLFGTGTINYFENSIYKSAYIGLDLTGYGSVAFKFGMVSVGANIKYIDSNYDKIYTDLVGLTGYEIKAEGKGMGFDLGAMVKLTNKINLGVKLENIATTLDISGTRTDYPSLSTSSVSGTETLPVKLNVGVAMKPLSGATIAADIQGYDLSGGTGGNNLSYHVGFEQKLAIFALRVGYEQNSYPTYGGSSYIDSFYCAGIGFDVIFGAIDVAARKSATSGSTYMMATAMIKI
jgi:hypothetical protein